MDHCESDSLTNLPVSFVLCNCNEDIGSLYLEQGEWGVKWWWEMVAAQELCLHTALSSLRQRLTHLIPLGTGKNQSHLPCASCDVVSEKTNEPAVLTAAFIGD